MLNLPIFGKLDASNQLVALYSKGLIAI